MESRKEGVYVTFEPLGEQYAEAAVLKRDTALCSRKLSKERSKF